MLGSLSKALSVGRRVVAQRWQPYLNATRLMSNSYDIKGRPTKTMLHRGMQGFLLAGTGLVVFYVVDSTINDDFDLVTDKFRPRLHPQETERRPRLVILGTGWGAMSMLRKLHTDKFRVTIVSPRNYFLFTPLLPSTTSGTIEPRSIIEPIRKYCSRSDADNAQFIEAECIDVDTKSRKLKLKRTTTGKDSKEVVSKSSKHAEEEFEIDYDILVTAVGMQPATFNISGVKDHALFMKELPDAKRVRGRIMDMFERANLPHVTEEEKRQLLQFVVVGGGPTGVETAAELSDFIKNDLSTAFKDLAPYTKITLVEAAPKVLGMFEEHLIQYTQNQLEKIGKIEVLTNSKVVKVDSENIYLAKREIKNGEVKDTEDYIPYGAFIWASGVAARPVTVKLAKLLHQDLAKNPKAHIRGLTVNGKFLAVTPSKQDLQEHGPVFAIGDCALAGLAPTAQVASQEGKYLGRVLNRLAEPLNKYTLAHRTKARTTDRNKATEELLEALEEEPDFQYRHFGSFAYIGDHTAVADFGDQHISSGLATFMMWRSVYFTKLMSVRNRMSVSTDWTKSLFFGRDLSRA
eukprot:Clim_evm18s183 gene=Clim_evmTU18s183